VIRKAYFLTLIMLLLVASAEAAVIYVDNSASCTGDDGSSSNPWCTIQDAFNNVTAGDTIRIRTGTGVYDQSATASNKDGTALSPITLEPDTGASFIIRDSGNGALRPAILILNSNNWIIRNLTFDDTGINPGRWGSLKIQADGATATDIQVTDNTFSNTGGTQAHSDANGTSAALVITGCPPALGCAGGGQFLSNVTVSGNTFENSRFKAITAVYTDGATISGNTIFGTKCGRETDTAANQVGMHLVFGNINMTVSGNTIRDFAPQSDCTLASQGFATTAGIWCDAGGTAATQSVTVERNLIYNISQSKTNQSNAFGSNHTSHGMFIEHTCSGWTIKNNLVYEIGNMGITNSYHSLDGSQSPNLYYNNTVYSVGIYGFLLKEGIATFRNNIISESGTAQICFGCESGDPDLSVLTADYNLYDDGGSQTLIGGHNGVKTLANWRTACSCDANSAAADPAFTSAGTDFSLRSSSPAKNTGDTLASVTNDYANISRPQGVAYDMGALEFDEDTGGGSSGSGTLELRVIRGL
jgi:parallel beta-helix repeat protein